MKRSLLLVFTLIMVAVLAAPRFTVNAQEKSLEIYITGLTEDTLNWFRDTAFPAFEQDHPGVKLDIITGGWGDFDATVAGWITTGEGPDIIYLGSEYAATYGSLLANMDPYLKDWEDLDKFLPAAVETVSFNGEMKGLPLLMSPRPMFYRTDLAKDGGENFKAPLTFEESLEFVKNNTVVTDNAIEQQGFMDIGGGLFDAQEFIAYVWSAGGELYKEDGSSNFDSAETAEALQFMYDRRRAVMPTEQVAGLSATDPNPLASGKVVSGIFPLWNAPATTDEIWNNIAIEPYPAGENGEPLIQVFIDWLAVPAYAEDPELAAEFLKFIGSRENALALSEVAGFTPVRTDAWEDIRKNPVWDRLIELAEEYGRAFSDIRASAELRPLIVEQVTLYLTDQQSLEDTQAALKSEYDAILKANGYLQD